MAILWPISKSGQAKFNMVGQICILHISIMIMIPLLIRKWLINLQYLFLVLLWLNSDKIMLLQLCMYVRSYINVLLWTFLVNVRKNFTCALVFVLANFKQSFHVLIQTHLFTYDYIRTYKSENFRKVLILWFSWVVIFVTTSICKFTN